MKFPRWLRVYGNKDFRGKCPQESVEQITFFNYLRREHHGTYGILAVHPRNEGVRHHAQTIRHKAEGMSTGASDIIIPGRPAFVCEMKRQNHTLSKWEDGQIEYLEAAQDAGAFVCVSLGYAGAKEAFEEWLKIIVDTG